MPGKANRSREAGNWSYEEVSASAKRHGLGPPEAQFECARQQLMRANVTHLDMKCKNWLLEEGAFTLIDFDAARVDGHFPPASVRIFSHRRHRHGSPSPPNSEQPTAWAQLHKNGTCFRR